MKEQYEEFGEDLEEETIEDVINNYDLNKVQKPVDEVREIIRKEQEQEEDYWNDENLEEEIQR